MAAKGQTNSVRTLAKQVVRSRQSASRLERTKCSMSAVSLHLTTAVASTTTASSLKMSANVMKEMNRAEMMDEVMDEGFAESDDEAEVDTEIAKVF